MTKIYSLFLIHSNSQREFLQFSSIDAALDAFRKKSDVVAPLGLTEFTNGIMTNIYKINPDKQSVREVSQN